MKRLLGFFGTLVVVAVLAIVATCLLASVTYVWCTEKIGAVLFHFKRSLHRPATGENLRHTNVPGYLTSISVPQSGQSPLSGGRSV